MRSVRAGLVAVVTTVVLGGTAVGAMLAHAAPGGPAGHAAGAAYHVTVVLAGQKLETGRVIDFGVTAKFATNTRCRVTKTEQICAFRQQQALLPQGAYFGILHVRDTIEAVHFRVTRAALVWDPVNRNVALSVEAAVTASTYADCLKGDRINVHAAVHGSEKGVTVSCEASSYSPFGFKMDKPAVALTGDALSSQWTVATHWQSHQSNKYDLTWDVAQDGTDLTGTVQFPPGQAEQAGLTQTGRITEGSVLGNKLDAILVFGITRSSGTLRAGGTLRGEYAGTITRGTTRRRAMIVDGRAWNPDHRAGTYTWTGSGPATCFGPCK